MSLSDKKVMCGMITSKYVYPEKNVKQFIKKLKKNFPLPSDDGVYDNELFTSKFIRKIIDKLAGDDLK